jgi:hypothetical protein
MGGRLMTLEVNASGPLLDGRAPGIIGAACQQGQDAVAREANNRVHARLHSVLRFPTGNYERHVVTDLAQRESRVTDSGIIYGHWLEGTGSRNRTTRFKGYFTFRAVTQEIRADAGRIAEDAMRPKLRELEQ